MYSIKMTCYDYGNPIPYEDTPAFNPKFDTFEEAYGYMEKVANDEEEYLDTECKDSLTSFGIVVDEEESIITVNCYMLESKEDTTGETLPVTIYEVVDNSVPVDEKPVSDAILGYLADHCKEPYDYAIGILGEANRDITPEELFDYCNETFGYKYSREEIMADVEEAMDIAER